MRRVLAVAVAACSLATVTAPADALFLKSGGVEGDLRVGNDFTACGEVHFPAGTTFVGELTAVGQVQGPGLKAGTVRGTLPFTGFGSWAGCIPGAYPGAMVGDGKFTLTAHAATDDYIHIKQCVVNAGVVTCV